MSAALRAWTGRRPAPAARAGPAGALTLLLSACSLSGPPAPPADAPVERLSLDLAALPPGVDYAGVVVSHARWRDSAGDNILLLTQTGRIAAGADCGDDCFDAEIYAYHYVDHAGTWSLLWRHADAERDCQFDLYVGFIADSLSITDLDADGLAESCFLYKASCRSDVSPARLELVMHEGAQGFAMHGQTTVPGAAAGPLQMDAALAAAPTAFRMFARDAWSRFVDESEFEQLD